ncbi:MAG: tetratricopeptide repeat protein [Acidobacteriota bacterium]
MLDANSFNQDENNSEKAPHCMAFQVFDFVRYFRGGLSSAEKAEIEEHCAECTTCKIIWFHLWYVLSGQERPTNEENFLLTKLLTSPIWDLKENDIIERIKQELHAYINELIERKLSRYERANKQSAENNPEEIILARKCSRWSETQFVNFCLLPTENNDFQEHLIGCELCLDRFLWTTAVILTKGIQAEKRESSDLSSQWQERKEELIQFHSDAIAKENERRQETQQLVTDLAKKVANAVNTGTNSTQIHINTYSDEELIGLMFDPSNDELVASWREFITRFEKPILKMVKRVCKRKSSEMLTNEKYVELFNDVFIHIKEDNYQFLRGLQFKKSGSLMIYMCAVTRDITLKAIGADSYDSADVDVELTLEDMKVLDSKAWKRAKNTIVSYSIATVASYTTTIIATFTQQPEQIHSQQSKDVKLERIVEEKEREEVSRVTPLCPDPVVTAEKAVNNSEAQKQPEKNDGNLDVNKGSEGTSLNFIIPMRDENEVRPRWGGQLLKIAVIIAVIIGAIFSSSPNKLGQSSAKQENKSAATSRKDTCNTPLYVVGSDFDEKGLLRYASNSEIDSETTDHFYKANEALKRLKENPDDPDALLIWAAWLEDLRLYREAEKCYLRWLLQDNESLERESVHQRWQHLVSKMAALPNKQETTLYDLLNQAIDNFLVARQTKDLLLAKQAMNNARKIAKQIRAKGDLYGLHLIEFYRNTPDDQIEKLQNARNLLASIEATPIADNFGGSLEKAEQAKLLFSECGAEIEIERADYLIVTYADKSFYFSKIKGLLDKRLEEAFKHGHVVLYAKFVLRQGAILTSQSDFKNGIASLQKAITIAKAVEFIEVQLRASIILSNTFWILNDNTSALKHAFETHQLAVENGNEQLAMGPLQTISASAFNLGYRELADYCLQTSIKVAEKNKSLGHLAYGYGYLSVLAAESGLFIEANDFSNKTFFYVHKITDEKARNFHTVTITSFSARVQALTGNYIESEKLYKKALLLAEDIGYEQKIFLSQLYQGLGECYIALEDFEKAKQNLLKADSLDKQAKKDFQTNNNLMTFSVTRKSCSHQLEMIAACAPN